MNAPDIINRLHQHRAWVNGNLMSAASVLTDEQLHAPFPIGQGTIWKSLVHLYAAEYVWLEALMGNEAAVVPGDLPGQLPGNQLGEGGISNLADLLQKWSALEERWTAYVSTLTPAALEETVSRKSSRSVSGKPLVSRRCDVLLHVYLHAHYTAAQVVNMFRQAGAEKLPETMLISLARQEMV